jgi:hypothetical protein
VGGRITIAYITKGFLGYNRTDEKLDVTFHITIKEVTNVKGGFAFAHQQVGWSTLSLPSGEPGI